MDEFDRLWLKIEAFWPLVRSAIIVVFWCCAVAWTIALLRSIRRQLAGIRRLLEDDRRPVTALPPPAPPATDEAEQRRGYLWQEKS